MPPQRRLSRTLLHLHPADTAIIAILIIAIITSFWANPRTLLAVHIAMLAAYVLAILILSKWRAKEWVAVAHPIVAMCTLWTLYCTLGWLGMAAMPFRADAALSHLDAKMFGGIDPTFLVQRWQSPRCVEFFAFFYGLFIPYIDLSLVLGAVGRPPLQRDQFLTGWVFVYCISYLGYIFLPAQGPGGFHAAHYSVPLHGGYFFNLVAVSVANTGGLRGVFPSLHVGSALYLCLFDLRTNRLRGLTYFPVVIMIYGATIILRYHYLIDLIAGTIISLLFVWAGPRIFTRWAAARSRSGLPPISGGDGVVLQSLPIPREPGAASLLQAN